MTLVATTRHTGHTRCLSTALSRPRVAFDGAWEFATRGSGEFHVRTSLRWVVVTNGSWNMASTSTSHGLAVMKAAMVSAPPRRRSGKRRNTPPQRKVASERAPALQSATALVVRRTRVAGRQMWIVVRIEGPQRAANA